MTADLFYKKKKKSKNERKTSKQSKYKNIKIRLTGFKTFDLTIHCQKHY